MKNIVMLFKNDEGNIVCRQINEAGIAYIKKMEETPDNSTVPLFWEDGGTILLEELNEILDKEV